QCSCPPSSGRVVACRKTLVGSQTSESSSGQVNQTEWACCFDANERPHGECGRGDDAGSGRPAKRLDQSAVQIPGKIADTILAGRSVEAIRSGRAEEKRSQVRAADADRGA